MKAKIFYLSFLLIIISIYFLPRTIYSQSSWFIVNSSSGTSDDINGLDFVSSSHAYAVGGNGIVYKTVNGGETWQISYNNASNDYFWAVSFVNEQTGWAVGNGTVIFTSDGGQNWQIQYSNFGAYFTDVHFVSELKGWAVGSNGNVIRTTNGGNTWIQSFSGNGLNLFNVQFIDENTGWIAGDAGIFRTTDGGISWNIQLNENWVYSVNFVNANTGWAGVRFGKMFKTTNGGLTWISQNSGTGATYYSMKFINENTGWAVGDYNTIIKTTDGGNSWVIENSSLSNGFAKFSCIDTYDNSGEICWIAGFSGVMLKTENGGADWESVFESQLGNTDLWSVYFTDFQTGFVAGTNGTIAKTVNGGFDWENYGNQYQWDFLIDIFFADQNTGWVVGHEGKIYRTTNSGLSWEMQNSGTHENLFNIFFTDQNTGFIAGDNGILKTTSGGNIWREVLDFNWMYSVFFINENTGWAGGRFGKLVKSTDGGINWRDLNSGTGATYYSVKFSDENNGWAVGDYNTIIRTTDGGETWTQQQSGIQGNSLKLSEIQIAPSDPNTAFISGYNGKILKTENAGLNWYKADVPSSTDYNSIYFPSYDVGYAVGTGGIVIKTTNRGITFAGNEQTNSPESYSLEQNYPNPFNPNTTIKYRIPANELVTLKVYDILGNEVATIVNGIQREGNYSVDFKGNGLSSGVYIYRLEAGNYSESKRMMLIK